MAYVLKVTVENRKIYKGFYLFNRQMDEDGVIVRKEVPTELLLYKQFLEHYLPDLPEEEKKKTRIKIEKLNKKISEGGREEVYIKLDAVEIRRILDGALIEAAPPPEQPSKAEIKRYRQRWKNASLTSPIHNKLMELSFYKACYEGITDLEFNASPDKRKKIDIIGTKAGKSIGIECRTPPVSKQTIEAYKKLVDKLIVSIPKGCLPRSHAFDGVEFWEFDLSRYGFGRIKVGR